MINKKAIMVDFLVTVLLALIIFVPACIGISKLFRTSEQAGQSYHDITGKLKDMDQQASPTTSTVLILDQDTAVVYFAPQQAAVQVYVEAVGSRESGGSGSGDYDVAIKRPASCDSADKGCLCLFQESKPIITRVDDSREKFFDNIHWFARIAADVIIEAKESACDQNFNSKLTLNDCSFGSSVIPSPALAYHCSNGFIIERGLFEKAGLVTYLQTPRRVALTMTKTGTEIELHKQ